MCSSDLFVSVRGLSPVVASGGHSSSRRAGPSPPQPLPLRSTGSRRAGSAIVAHGPSCSAACGILPDQGSNPCPLHCQADSQPLRHQGSPERVILCLQSIQVGGVMQVCESCNVKYDAGTQWELDLEDGVVKERTEE